MLFYSYIHEYYSLYSFEQTTFIRKIDITPIAFHKMFSIDNPFNENGKRVS